MAKPQRQLLEPFPVRNDEDYQRRLNHLPKNKARLASGESVCGQQHGQEPWTLKEQEGMLAAEEAVLASYAQARPKSPAYMTFQTEADWNAHLETMPAYAAGKAAGEAEIAAGTLKVYGPGNAQYERDVAEGAREERERIMSIQAHTLKGHEDLAHEAIYGEKPMSVADFALAQLRAEDTYRTDYLSKVVSDAPQPVPLSFGSAQADAVAANPSPMTDANALAKRIQQHQAAAKAEGRTITTAQAAAEIQRR